MLTRKYIDTKDEGMVIEMGKKRNKKVEIEQEDNRKFTRPEILAIISISLAVISIASTVCMGLFSVNSSNKMMELGWSKEDSDTLKSLEGLPEQIEEIEETREKDNKAFERRLDEFDCRLTETATIVNMLPIIANNGMAIEIPGVQANPAVATKTSLSEASVLGETRDGEECLAGDYKNEAVFLTYTENGRDVLFWGMLNENLQWSGYCVTNAYNADGTLYGICESNFDDGNRLDYKSFINDGNGKWIYSERECRDNYNAGINKTFRYSTSRVKDFTQSNVRAVDFLYVDKYLDNNEMVLLWEYRGNTVEGKYNDTTGKANYISYYDDGSVKTLYQGKFVDGLFNDTTGKAWQISCDRDRNAKYQYYQGPFRDGEKLNNYNQKNDLTEKQIKRILNEKKCKITLIWDKQSLALE